MHVAPVPRSAPQAKDAPPPSLNANLILVYAFVFFFCCFEVLQFYVHGAKKYLACRLGM